MDIIAWCPALSVLYDVFVVSRGTRVHSMLQRSSKRIKPDFVAQTSWPAVFAEMKKVRIFVPETADGMSVL